ncbi:hypothetical protein FB451DRAFT_638393 [Mycena latifolia]|nr:hypothetical protein FB451DRAFT_638393 [Mycena latifolia]
MRWLNLRNSLKRGRQTQSTTASSSPLPPEVWELVFEELTDESLLVAARVCSAFNDRCIAIHLRRNGISPDLLAAGILNIYSPLLSVLQLSRLTPRIHSLICHFSPFRVLRDMKVLRELIGRFPGLRELRISFSGDMLKAHIIDTIFPYSQRALLTEFCNVIRTTVAKTAAPVVVIESGYIYRARPRDLADWGLRYFLYWEHFFGRVGWIDKAWAVLTPKRRDPIFFLPSWSGGARQKLTYTRYLHSIEVRAIPAASDGTEPFTLVVFQPTTANDLIVTPSITGKTGISGPPLTRIIPLVTLPSLRRLSINEVVDPAILLQFLRRHPTILVLRYNVTETEPESTSSGSPNPLRRRLLTTVPIALPALQDLDCWDAAHASSLLDSFGLSPQLSSIQIWFQRYSAPHVASLKLALRRLSLHPTAITLRMSISYCTEEHLLIDEEERYIVGCLYGVWCVRISAGEMTEVVPFIPWLGMLPALNRLEVSVYSRVVESPETASGLAKMRIALPWVPHIELQR